MRTIPYTIGVLSLLREVWYTVCQMREEPLASPHLQTFENLYQEAKNTLLPSELSVTEEVESSQVKVDRADGDLDRFAGRVSRAVDDIPDPNTRKQYKTNLFKGQPLSKFRRPVLGGQLLAQSGWAATLSQSNVPALVTLADEADPLVKKGQDASQSRTEAQQQNRQFRDVGARKQFIDKLNGARRLAAGSLAKLAHDSPALPNDYADRFWRTEPAVDEEETLDDVKAAIADLKAKLAEREDQLKKMEADVAAAAQLEAFRCDDALTLFGATGGRFGVANATTFSFGARWEEVTASVGLSLAEYSLSLCGAGWCGQVRGLSPGADARLDIFRENLLRGALGLSANCGTLWIVGQASSMWSGFSTRCTLGPILRLSSR
jgi:hypothetical protein